MNANNRFMNYTIANIRVSLPDACTGEHFTRALRPFLTLGAGPADLALEIVPRIPAEADYRELDIFEFPDADADCRFGTDAAGYLLEMTPRDGSAPARYRMAYGAAAARSDITPGHNPALFRFGVWILFNIAALPLGAVAFHSSVISYRGRGVLFLGESGTGKSTHTRLWREHIPGAELLNDDSPIIRATDSEALVHGSPWSGKTPCYRNESCPIAAVVRLSQAPHNRIRRLRPIESIGALLPSAPPAFARDERLSDDTCGLLSRLIAQVPVYHLECLPDAAAAQRALARLRSDPDVTDCFLDEAVTADDTLAGLWDETASRSWGGHEMGLTTLRHQADVLLPAGRRATVAVIDTGAEVSHPLLAGRVSARSYDFADNTASVTDVNGHGTATAGLVADLTPDEVDVMVLRVYGDDNLSKPSRVLTALEYALENGATVVNMSIGWPNAIEKGYSFLNSVLAQAYAAGVVVVAAAGNLSRSNPTANADDVYPANQAQVLTVSAVDRSRTFDDTYSASGASVDLCAPGTGVAVAALSDGMTVRSGTSFAAPHVAAAAACVQLAQPGATAARVRRTLCDYAEDLGAPGRDDQYGNGFPVLTQCFHDRLCPGRRFADMPDADAWSHAGLDYCIAAGLMHGMTPVTVAPEALATRAQVVQLLWAAAGSPKTTGTLPFTDVAPGAWYYDAVHWAYRTGLVSGTSPTTFTPDAAITRQDFTVILYAQAGRPAMTGTALAAFPDAGQVAGYAYAALTWAVEQGLIGGVGTQSGPQLAPRGYATRAQVAKILMGYYDK